MGARSWVPPSTRLTTETRRSKVGRAVESGALRQERKEEREQGVGRKPGDLVAQLNENTQFAAPRRAAVVAQPPTR